MKLSSIRTRLFLNLTALMLAFVLLSLSLTLLGLEKFYLWQKEKVLITNSQTIANIYHGDPEEIALELERLGSLLGAGVFILDKNGEAKYNFMGRIFSQKMQQQTSAPAAGNNLTEQSVAAPLEPAAGAGGAVKTTSLETNDHRPGGPHIIPPHISKTSEIVDNKTTLEVQLDQMLKIDFVVLYRQLENDDVLLIRQPLAPISESATVAAQFIALTGLLCLIAGCLWSFFFAQKITLPILELNQIAQSMTQLNFSQKCTLRRNDELGQLAQSINELSQQLDSAITELNLKNQQLKADVEKERSLDKMRKNFVSSVSHELKTPLSLILGYAEGLRENVAHDEETRNFYATVIMDEAERMDKLVRDLLNLSQIESGLFLLDRINFNLTPLVISIVQKYQTTIHNKKINLQADLPATLLINGDPLRIEQIILNLLNNAISHVQTEKIILITTQKLSGHIRFAIFNSGAHIPADSLAKLWISFYKVDKSRNRDKGGYGLGLSIVRGIQELHGNSYGVDNVPGGVSFWVDLDQSHN